MSKWNTFKCNVFHWFFLGNNSSLKPIHIRTLRLPVEYFPHLLWSFPLFHSRYMCLSTDKILVNVLIRHNKLSHALIDTKFRTLPDKLAFEFYPCRNTSQCNVIIKCIWIFSKEAPRLGVDAACLCSCVFCRASCQGSYSSLRRSLFLAPATQGCLLYASCWDRDMFPTM